MTMQIYTKAIKSDGGVDLEIVKGSTQIIKTLSKQEVTELLGGNSVPDFTEKFNILNQSLKHPQIVSMCEAEIEGYLAEKQVAQ